MNKGHPREVRWRAQGHMTITRDWDWLSDSEVMWLWLRTKIFAKSQYSTLSRHPLSTTAFPPSRVPCWWTEDPDAGLEPGHAPPAPTYTVQLPWRPYIDFINHGLFFFFKVCLSFWSDFPYGQPTGWKSVRLKTQGFRKQRGKKRQWKRQREDPCAASVDWKASSTSIPHSQEGSSDKGTLASLCRSITYCLHPAGDTPL